MKVLQFPITDRISAPWTQVEPMASLYDRRSILTPGEGIAGSLTLVMRHLPKFFLVVDTVLDFRPRLFPPVVAAEPLPADVSGAFPHQDIQDDQPLT